MRECLACGGQYEPVQSDGVRYFHVCAPLVTLRVKRGNATIDIDPAERKEGDVELDRLYTKRDDHVDENVTVVGANPEKGILGKVVPISEGAGFKEIQAGTRTRGR